MLFDERPRSSEPRSAVFPRGHAHLVWRRALARTRVSATSGPATPLPARSCCSERCWPGLSRRLAVSESARWSMLAIVAADPCLRPAGRCGDPRHRQRVATGAGRAPRARGGRGRGRCRRRRTRRAGAVFRLDRPSPRRTGPAQRRLGAGRRPGVGIPATNEEAHARARQRRRTGPREPGQGVGRRALRIQPHARPARRPGSPVSPVPGPKHERRTSFSPTHSMSWTTRWRPATARHPSWTPRSPARSRRSPRHARAWSRTPVGASARAGSR